jgi:hypothetical protein
MKLSVLGTEPLVLCAVVENILNLHVDKNLTNKGAVS